MLLSLFMLNDFDNFSMPLHFKLFWKVSFVQWNCILILLIIINSNLNLYMVLHYLAQLIIFYISCTLLLHIPTSLQLTLQQFHNCLLMFSILCCIYSFLYVILIYYSLCVHVALCWHVSYSAVLWQGLNFFET